MHPKWSGTHYAHQTALKLTDLLASASEVLGLKVSHATSRLTVHLVIYYVIHSCSVWQHLFPSSLATQTILGNQLTYTSKVLKSKQVSLEDLIWECEGLLP